MKILKKAQQKNLVIDTGYYTLSEIYEMLEKHEISYFNDKFEECYVLPSYYEIEEMQFIIFTENLIEIKVVCEDGYYIVKAFGKNGKDYYISL